MFKKFSLSIILFLSLILVPSFSSFAASSNVLSGRNDVAFRSSAPVYFHLSDELYFPNLGLVAGNYYVINYNGSISYSGSSSTAVRVLNPTFTVGPTLVSTSPYFETLLVQGDQLLSTKRSISQSGSTVVYCDRNNYLYLYFYCGLTSTTTTQIAVNALSFTCNLTISNANKLSTTDAAAIQAAFDQGYSAGFSSGETSGYSSGFAAGVDSVDTQSFYDQGYAAGVSSVDLQIPYDEGFAAGVDSVDTQSFYDQGYSFGFSQGYNSGLDVGYSSGYSAARNEILHDQSDYPKLAHYWNRDTISLSSIDSYFWANAGYVYHFSDYVSPDHYYLVKVTTSPSSSSWSLDTIQRRFVWVTSSSGYDWEAVPAWTSDSRSANFWCKGSDMQDWVSYIRIYDSDLGSTFAFRVELWDYGISTSEFYGYDNGVANNAASSLGNAVDHQDALENSIFTSSTNYINDFDISPIEDTFGSISFISTFITSFYEKSGPFAEVVTLIFVFSVIGTAIGFYRVKNRIGGKD